MLLGRHQRSTWQHGRRWLEMAHVRTLDLLFVLCLLFSWSPVFMSDGSTSAVADLRRGGLPPPLFGVSFTKAKFTSKKVVLNKYKICLKMLEMAILETQIFKNFWESMPPDPPWKAHTFAVHGAPPPFESPESVPEVEELLCQLNAVMLYYIILHIVCVPGICHCNCCCMFYWEHQEFSC